MAAVFLCESRGQEAPSQWDFKVIETPHFRIIYNAKQQELGDYYAREVENVFAKVAAYFTEWPSKVALVLTDRTDLPNGYATVVPYPLIVLYPVVPMANDSLSGFRNWGFELLGHELTHIMSFVPTRDFVTPLRYVFGSIVAPNLLMPLWWKEGVAVALESVDGGGRLNSDYQESLLRAFVLEDRLSEISIADVNEVGAEWPEGLKPYLFGSLIWKELVERKGGKVFDNLVLAQSGRIPYLINDPVKEEVGLNYEGVYREALAKIVEKVKADTATLSAVAPSKYEEVAKRRKDVEKIVKVIIP